MDRSAIMDGLGLRTHGTASLMLSLSDALPPHMRNGVRELTGLQTPEADRCQGLASMLMQKVCAEADKNKLVLLLTPGEGLDGFYQQFGFIAIQTNPTLMARQTHG